MLIQSLKDYHYDRKLDEYLEKKAKIKFNNDITTKAEDYKVFYENAYKKIK